MGFVGPAYAYIPITFDKPLYFVNHGAVITVDDTNDQYLNTNLHNGNMQVKLTSYANTNGAWFTFNNVAGTNFFTSNGYINFTTNTGSNPNNFLVQDNPYPSSDTVTAWVGADAGSIQVFDNNYKTMPTANQNRQPNFNTKITCTANTSGDGICDEWKSPNSGNGITITLNSQTFFFPCPPQDPCGYVPSKEVFVEVVAMKDQMPSTQTITDMKTAFAAQGIKLHVYLDTEMDYHQFTITGPATGTTDFSNIKAATFGTADERAGNTSPCNTKSGSDQDACVANLLTAKRQFFHYALFANKQPAPNLGSTGLSELPGNDILNTLGPVPNGGGYGTVDQQEGTFMHELGHNLGLYHGGNNNLNCKPNYLSVMSYSQQLKDINPHRTLDYSHGTSPALLKNGLVEQNGIGLSGSWTVYGPTPAIVNQTGVPLNYNPTQDRDMTNTLPNIKLENVGIPGCSYTTDYDMYDFNDWGNLKFDIRGTTNFGSGAGSATSDDTDGGGLYTDYNYNANSANGIIFVSDYSKSPDTSNLIQTTPDKTNKDGLDDTTGPAKEVIKKTMTDVDGILNNAITDIKNQGTDSVNDLKAAGQSADKLNWTLSNVIGNLTNAKTRAPSQFNMIFSDEKKDYKDKTLVDTGANITNAFANATFTLDQSFGNTNDKILSDAYHDLRNVINDQKGDVEKRISEARVNPNFVQWLYQNPDKSISTAHEANSTLIRQMRTTHIDTINYTIFNLTPDKFTNYDSAPLSQKIQDENTKKIKSTFSDQLKNVTNFVYTDDLVSAISKLNYIKTEMDNSTGGNAQDDLIKDPAAQAEIIGMINDAILSYDIAMTPSHSPYDGAYNSLVLPIIPLWMVYLFIGIIIGLVVLAIWLSNNGRKWKKKAQHEIEKQK